MPEEGPFCSNCGTRNEGDAAFCEMCGQALDADAVPVAVGPGAAGRTRARWRSRWVFIPAAVALLVAGIPLVMPTSFDWITNTIAKAVGPARDNAQAAPSRPGAVSAPASPPTTAFGDTALNPPATAPRKPAARRTPPGPPLGPRGADAARTRDDPKDTLSYIPIPSGSNATITVRDPSGVTTTSRDDRRDVGARTAVTPDSAIVTIPSRPGAPESPAGRIGAGTVLPLRAIDQVCTDRNKEGDRFRTAVDEEVPGTDGARIPKGTVVTFVIDRLKPSGNANEQSVLSVAAKSIELNGESLPLDASVVGNQIGTRSRCIERNTIWYITLEADVSPGGE